jgi:hypothetical protein
MGRCVQQSMSPMSAGLPARYASPGWAAHLDRLGELNA